MKLPPYTLISTAVEWLDCLAKLKNERRLAIDLEANSMFAYREQVCLIQISIPGLDYIVDPLKNLDISGLGEIIQDTAVEKVFHAAEYDLILMKREYGWELQNLFDTMWAARILGYERVGLANILNDLYQVKLDKRYQKANWCKRPLSPEHLRYAQCDTHYLLSLRDHLAAKLEEEARTEEAWEIFAEQREVSPGSHDFDPNSFWSITGAYDLTRQEQAILKALHIFRNKEAKRRNQPLFKIFGDKTMLDMARAAPDHTGELYQIHGMSTGQIQRYGAQLLRVVQESRQAPPPAMPRKNHRFPAKIYHLYEKLHTWRKERALQRGAESDVILSRDALWAIAQANPQTMAELAELKGIGPWRCRTYGQEILALIKE